MGDWVVTGTSPMPAANAPVPVPPAAAAPGQQWVVTGETPLSANPAATAAVAASAHPVSSGINSFVDSTLKALAVPGKPEWNLDNLGTYLQSKIPGWAGGQSEQQQNLQEQADIAAHPYAADAGSFTGHGLEAAGVGALTDGIGDAVMPGSGLAATLGRSTLSNAAAGAAATPDHPLEGAVVGGGLGAAGSAVGAAGRSLAGALRAVKNPALVADMTNVGLTPTAYAAGRPVIRNLANAVAAAKDNVTKFSQTDLVKAALKPFGITDTTDLTNSTIGRAEAATWNATNQLAKNSTITPQPSLVQNLASIIAKYKANVGTPDLDSSVDSYANDILNKAASGSWSGENALNLFRTIRNRSYSASDPFTKQALGEIAQTLEGTIGASSPDLATSLAESNALHQKLLVLKSVAEKANKNPNGLPTLAEFAQSNKTETPFGSVEGPYQQLVNAAQSAYTPAAGSTARYANPLAALLSKTAPLLAGSGAEHLMGPLGWLVGPAVEHYGERGLASALSKAALRQVGQGAAPAATSAGRNALARALVGLTANGATQLSN